MYNEPNCGFFDGSQEEYFKLFNCTGTALKSVDPLIKFGGPATCALGWIPELFAFLQASGAPADIVTTHLYPTDDRVAKSRDGFAAAIAEAAANVTRLGRPGMPLVITEFNAGLGLPTEVNGDTAHSAAFVLHNALALQGVANLEALSFWSVSDIFEEGGMDSQPFHNGFGIQSIYAVKKPVYRAMQMLAALPPAGVPVAFTGAAARAAHARAGSASAGAVDVVVGVDASGAPVRAVTALLTNYDYFGAPPNATVVELTFANLPAGCVLPAAATLELIDSTHANPNAEWLAQGGPMYPTQAQSDAQVAASLLVEEALPLTRVGATSARVSVPLEAFAVARVRFSFE